MQNKESLMPQSEPRMPDSAPVPQETGGDSERFTPGPWTINVHRPTGDVGILTEQRHILAECFAEIRRYQENAREEALANARLIVRAPAMHAALKSCEATCDRIIEQYGPVQCGVNFDALRTGIRAALGAKP